MRKVLAGFLLGSGAAALVLALAWGGWLEAAERRTYDWRTRRVADASAANPDIVLVEVNDSTVRDLAPVYGRWPWPRVVFSALIDYLNRAPARVIAVDFTFLEEQRHVTFKVGGDDGETWSGEQSDAALVDSVRAASVVLLADAEYIGNVGGDQLNPLVGWTSPFHRLGPAIEERPLIRPPFATLAAAARALGHNFLPLDDDGTARRMPPFIRSGDRYLPSLGVAAALMAGGFPPDEVMLEGRGIRIRDRVMPLVAGRVPDALDARGTHEQLTSLIDYRVPAFLPDGSRPYKSYEARHLFVSEDQILSGTKPLVDPAEFRNKIVFIGQTLSGNVDVFQTPFRQPMPGIQLHANIAGSVLSGRFVRPAGVGADVASTFGGALVVGLLVVAVPFVWAAAAAAVAVTGWTWFAVEAFRRGLSANMASPLLAMAVTLFAGTAYRYFVEDREKRKVKRLFGRYVSRDVYAQLLDNPALAELGGARRHMTVLFSDIRGFTSTTEQGNPEALVAQLNEYFSTMVDVVFRHHGTVDKFVGDMVMALFGAPVDDEDHAEHAVAAAVEMIAQLAALNARWLADGRAPLDIGIGVNSGDMIAGNIGSSSIMSYTVIGDNVNLGSRLESLNKEYGSRIIISEATRVQLRGRYDTRALGDVVVKGKTRAVSIFEVVVPSPIPAAAGEATI